MNLQISLEDQIAENETLVIYESNDWSAANNPKQLMAALRNSHSLVTARLNGELVGIGNAISDGHLVVYYPHLLVLPKHQGYGIGRKMLATMQNKYRGYHQQVLLSDDKAVEFYKSTGFVRAGKTEPMWVYSGSDH